MRFELSDDQQEIQRTARDLLASRASWAKVREAAEARRTDDGLWRELADLGWPGIAIGEDHGGQGLGMVELAVLVEELGYACAPVPLLGTALAALAVEHAGSDRHRSELLPGLASGAVTGALGVVAAGGGADLVPDAPGAGVVVLADRAAGTGQLADPGAVELVEAIDPTRRYGSVAAGSEDLPGDLQPVLDRAAVAVSAELLGVCRRALEMTVEYVKERKQFGTPVGAFQAVAHSAAQMLRDTEGAKALVYNAAWAADADPGQLPMAAAMAKTAASDAARSVTASAIQLHGGIGFTWEADVHWLFKRAQVSAAYLGSGSFHRAWIAQLATPGAAR